MGRSVLGLTAPAHTAMVSDNG